MTMTVNISGTFSEKHRPDNGLERVAEFMDEHRITQVPVVAIVEWHANGENQKGKKMAVAIKAIEPGFESDGSDPHGAGQQIRALLDELRKRAGLASVEETLFSAAKGTFDFDEDGGVTARPEIEGQEALPIRLGPDGECEVPEASAEEILAEREEAKAGGVPAASFSGGAE
ncbi:hypothetical protein [Actinoplanes palleronii]|uniref:Uncharacterized protein n=1 Tax=Actinoplanes palleronii TaxID=113570 RepID=A0ABQ4B4H3_9ACTN|nr:hypothetical protein [Actinoplanes palleronii]GIE65381.1 hypothetical protein Apa02nite_014890 [Actinoplanes palleronii]